MVYNNSMRMSVNITPPAMPCSLYMCSTAVWGGGTTYCIYV